MLMRKKSLKIKRQYIHCELLEEAPMWDNIQPKSWDRYAELSAGIMRENDVFYSSCLDVFSQWPNSSIHNLSNRSLNRMAWIGHAACFLNCGSVEYTTRLGWRTLDEDEQKEANNIAAIAIKEWERIQCQK